MTSMSVNQSAREASSNDTNLDHQLVNNENEQKDSFNKFSKVQESKS